MRFAALLLLAGCQPPCYHSGSSADAAGSGSGLADAAIAADASPDGPAGTTCSYPFQLFGHGGSMSVWLSGDFVAWGADLADGAIAMTLGQDASWSVTHVFMAGTYQYKFIVDGTMWIADPADADVVPDGDGGYNSVYTCTPM
jgi:expansin (peptidoglycan-binding protein)